MSRTAKPLAVFALLGGLFAVSPTEATSYRVGAGAVPITPKVASDAPPVWLAGYGIGRQAETAHDDIWARAMVIHDGEFGLAIVSCDLVGLFYDHVQLIRRQVAELGLTPKIDYIVVSSTHTHAGPDTIGIWGPFGRTGIGKGFLEKVRSGCVEAIKQAHEGLEPAKLRIAQIDVNRFAKLIGDSRKPQVIDSRLTVLQAMGKDRKAVATLVNIPCHPEVLGGKNKHLSSDFPSTMREHLEKQYGGIAVYNSGTLGGLLAPREPDVDPFTKKPKPKDEIRQMMWYGRIMGRIVDEALAKAKPLNGPIAVACEQVVIPIWNRIYITAMRAGLFARKVYHADATPVEIPKRKPKVGPKVPKIEDPHLLTEVALVEIGDLQMALIPGEIYPEITMGKYQRPQEANADFPGAPLEPTIYPQMNGKYKMVIGLANDEVGYIIPKSQWDWFHPYAYGRSKRQYGEVNSCGPEVAPRLMAAWDRLIKSRK